MTIVKEVADLVDEVGIGDLIKLGVSLTEKGIDAGSKFYAKKAEERDSLIAVPEVHSSDYCVNLEDAKRWLEEDGLKVATVIAKPDIAYKDCANLEIVATNFKLNKKVKPGTRIILQYVTVEVIEDSKKLFDEAEKLRIVAEEEKAIRNEEKAKKKAEQEIKNKQKIDEVITTVKSGLNDVVTNSQKGISRVFSGFTKKAHSKEKNDSPREEESD